MRHLATANLPCSRVLGNVGCLFLLIHALAGPGSLVAADRGNAPQEKPDVLTPVRQVPDPGVIPTNQSISPAGMQSVFESNVEGIAFGASSQEVYVGTDGPPGTLLYKLDWKTNEVVERKNLNSRRFGLHGLTYDPSTRAALVTKIDKDGVRLVYQWNSGKEPTAILLGKSNIAQVAVSPAGATGTHYGVVALTFDDQAAILDLTSGTVLSKVKVGIAPFATLIDAGNTTAYVTNWGGRVPHAGDVTATTGFNPGADSVVVDARGVAASGTVSRIDLKTGTVTGEVEVGLHPIALALDHRRNRLYVANANSDTISVIDTAENAVVETVSLQPFGRNLAGIAPESLVLSKDGQRLYTACAGINAVAVLALKSGRMTMEGLIPTGWYPHSIALSPDGKFLGVATLLGVGSGWKNSGSSCPQLSPHCRHDSSAHRGTIHIISIPGSTELKRYTLAVAQNNHLKWKGSPSTEEGNETTPEARPVPLRAGDPSPIKHILYIIKENNTYDMFFGGLGKGNGDPKLELPGATDMLPNHRKLVNDYVLLDNFYVDGSWASVDGHQWVTQANDTDYAYLRGIEGRSYPDDGSDPLTHARGGFLWNAVLDAGKTFADFGEFNGNERKAPPTNETRQQALEDFKNGASFEGKYTNWPAMITSLNPYVVPDYPGWSSLAPDVVHATIFKNHLKKWEAEDNMPSLMLMALPWDHTLGTSPGTSTPRACIADNDYGLGMIVDAISHSKFWASTLILVVEDDAANGPDHVDGHRTVALAISPYIKRNSIDSTFYSQVSMVKTIELILGLRNLSMYDLIATDMRNSFQDHPDLTPYAAIVPKQSIYEVNPPLKALSGQARKDARASLRMDFSTPDVSTGTLSRIVWRNFHGVDSPFPKVQHAIFAPYSNGADDDEQEEPGGEK